MAYPLFNTPATPYAGNPVIPLASLPPWGSNQVFDYVSMIDPADPSTVLMYVSGSQDENLNTCTIGMYTLALADPYTFRLVGVIVPPAGAGFRSIGTRMGSVYIDPLDHTKRYLFFTGYDGSGNGSIGVATSADGYTWTVSGTTPIITPTGNGRNDGNFVSEPAVIPYNSKLTLIYGYRNGGTILPGYRFAECASTSDADIKDASKWVKGGSGDILTTAPLYAEFHQILHVNGEYILLYESGGAVASNVPYENYAASASTPQSAFTPLNGGAALIPPSGGVGAWDRYHTATPGAPSLNGEFQFLNGLPLCYYCAAGNHLEPYYTNPWATGVATLAVHADVTTFLFDLGALNLQSGVADFLGGTIKARLINASITPLIDAVSMTGLTGVGTDATLASKTVVNDTVNHRTVYSAANPTITSPGTGTDYAAVVVYDFHGGGDANCIPLFCYAITPGTTDGTALLLAIPATGLGYTQQ